MFCSPPSAVSDLCRESRPCCAGLARFPPVRQQGGSALSSPFPALQFQRQRFPLGLRRRIKEHTIGCPRSARNRNAPYMQATKLPPTLSWQLQATQENTQCATWCPERRGLQRLYDNTDPQRTNHAVFSRFCSIPRGVTGWDGDRRASRNIHMSLWGNPRASPKQGTDHAHWRHWLSDWALAASD